MTSSGWPRPALDLHHLACEHPRRGEPVKPEGVRAFRARRRRILAQLKRVNPALSRWDEHEAHVLRLSTPKRPSKPPLISREALKSLQGMLTEELSPIEEMWERRN